MSDSSAETTFEVKIPAPEPSKGEREYQAFLRLLPELLRTHQGQYVAIHDGQVVDTDTSDIVLVQRVHGRFGYIPIHVGLVSHQVPVARVPYYREYRRQERA
jgi:hypothetical protein